jgi:predicted ATP-dependent protease
MESVNYMGGGPSAGFALSINTLSVLLEIPICNDFGITGAPAIRGTSKDKAGSSVMIGGEDKKSERVLLNLRRMYVPKKNYDAIPLDQQESYWNEGKIIIPVGDYREVIAEVLYFGKESMKILDKLIDSRIEYNKERIIKDESELTEKGDEIKRLEITLKEIAESEIKRRLIAIYNFCTDQKRDEFSSLEAIFTKYDPLKK